MVVIGLTGGIATGKSTVSQMLAELGAVILDADKAGHEALKRGGEVWREVVVSFGEMILGSKGEIDRRRLGELVFNNPEARERLNVIVHPRLKVRLKEEVAALRQGGVRVIVLEAALLVEAGWTGMVDEVWVTEASQDTVICRLKERNNFTSEQAIARIQAQLAGEERRRWAQVVIDTDCSITKVREQVLEQWQRLESLCSQGESISPSSVK